jgi:hypothetical protein
MMGLIFLLAIIVPVGLYLLSQMSFGGDETEKGAVASNAATNPSPAANIIVPQAPRNPPSGGSGLKMDLLVIDQVTRQPIPGLTTEVTASNGFRGRTGADGHVRVPLPADTHPEDFNFRVRGKNYVPLRMYWTTSEAALNDGAFPVTYTMEMEHGTRIGGKIVDEAGKPVAGATLQLQFTKHFSNPHQLIAAIAGFIPGHPTVSDAQGNWSFGGAPANCEEIEIAVRERGGANADIGPPQPYTPVSELYAGTATVRLQRNATGNIAHNGLTSGPMVRGTVTDEQTGNPIDSLRITVGFMFNDGQPRWWPTGSPFERDLQITAGGKFQYPKPANAFINIAGKPAPMVFKVEAKGYLPVVTRPIQPGDGDEVLDVKMKHGEDLIVTLVSADGKPIAGARAWVAAAGNEALSIRDGAADPSPNQQQPQTSGPDGRITFTQQLGHFELLVMANEGFADANQDELAKSKTIALLHWARIEGRLMVGTQPARAANVILRQDRIGPYGPTEPHVELWATARTDDTGQFTVEQLPPGHWVIGWRMPPSSANSMIQSFDATAGETVHVVAGGKGRPIVGTVRLPPDLAARSDWFYGDSWIDPDVEGMAPPIPAEIQMEPREEKQRWWIAWLNSDAGKAFMENRRKETGDRYPKPIIVAADGSFRVDDVVPGQYEVNIRLRVGGTADVFDLASGSAALTVAPIPGERSDEPLQIDPITIVPLGKYKIGDAVYDLHLISTDGEKLKLSDLRGKFILLEFVDETPSPAEPGFKDAYETYGQDSRLVMMRIRSRMWVSPSQSPARQPDIPWKQAMISDHGNTADLIFERNFAARWGGAWLIGPDGVVVAEGLQKDGVSAAVRAALGAPATQGSAGH